MKSPLLNDRSLAVMEEKLAVLNGDRGDPELAALRRNQLAALRALLAGLTQRANQVAAQLDVIDAEILALSGTVATLEAEITTAQADIDAITAAIPTILTDVEDLQDRMDAAEVVTFAVATLAPAATGDAEIFQI